MGIASFSPTGLLGSFHGLVGWLTAARAPRQRVRLQSQALRPAPVRGDAYASHAGSAPMRIACSTHGQAASSSRPLRPLRVLRIVDTSHVAASAGRMLISGRMADVCAELDRLAAQEVCPRNGALLQ